VVKICISLLTTGFLSREAYKQNCLGVEGAPAEHRPPIVVDEADSYRKRLEQGVARISKYKL
jgi:hypothetical protein